MKNFLYAQTARILKNGGIIAYPTESVYGLGCNPFDYYAVSRLIRIKRREPGKGFIMVAASDAQIMNLIERPDDNIWEKVKNSWPGPVSWVFKKSGRCPPWLGTGDTIAIRVSADCHIRNICRAAEMPILSTSANLKGHPPATTSLKARRFLKTKIDYLVAGKTGANSRVSTIISAITLERLR